MFILFCLNSIILFSQQTPFYTGSDSKYNKAVDLFNRQKYGQAQELFKTYIEENPITTTETLIEAEYYNAMCALNLMNDDAEYLVFQFVAHYPESPKVNQLKFELAKYHYQNKKNNNTLKALKSVDHNQLTPEEQAEYFFMKGYSLFMKNDYDEARVAFYEIIDKDTKFTSPAIYYYSHINYTQENYQTALEGFNRLKDDETFSPIAPYYIVQILFIQKKYQEIVEYAPPILENVTKKRKAEVAKIIGLSYYNMKQYKDAIPYLIIYTEDTESVDKEDWYQLGYSYYFEKQYDKAVEAFKKIAYGNNALSQNGLYHLADCYLKLNKKDEARMAFMGASKMDYDKDIKEDALYHYALVTHETSFSPFNETIKAFEEYLKLYPRSPRNDEVYKHLAVVYLHTKNYKAAYESMQKIKNPNESINKAKQKITYYRGLELFNNLAFDEALKMFDISLENQEYDALLAAQAYYWSGEACYRLEEFDEALEKYNSFLESNLAKRVPEYSQIHYNMGYCFFSKKEYQKSLEQFLKFESTATSKPSNLLYDAYNRIADCYYTLTQYDNSLTYYNKNITAGKFDVEYAMYQKGQALGLLKRHQEKISIDNTLITKFPNSPYQDDALFELGKTYTIVNEDNKAIESYQTIIKNYPNSSYYSKAYVQLGLIYYNDGNNEKALETYKKVVEGFPGSAESENALTGIRNIYVDMNNIEAYFAYVESLGTQTSVSMAEQDSLSYITAENLYMTGDCDKAKSSFIKYIDRFKDGKFLINAHYYSGDCQYKSQEYDEALASFNYILDKPKNPFTEPAFLGAANINYWNKDYEEALNNYIQLENIAEVKTNIQAAKTGRMRCYFYLNKYEEAIKAATHVLEAEKLTDNMRSEANYIMGKCKLAIGDYDGAIDHLLIPARDLSTDRGAESKYMLADIYYTMGKIVESRAVIYDFIDKGTPHEYWLAKAFILLSDIFSETNNEFQAVYTLQSIIDDYSVPDDGIIQTAKSKKVLILNQMQEKGINIDDANIKIE